MPRPTRALIEELLARYDERISEAFLNNIVLRVVVERLERGDVNGAIEAMNLEPEAFARLELAIAEAYNGGGLATVQNLPKLTRPGRQSDRLQWGVRNPEAEAWLREHSSTLVTRIVDDQRDGIRTALTEGLSRGDNPRRTALDVVGRVSQATNRREGGVIGITATQGHHVATARQELLSSDPDQLQNYLNRGRRDKRFDRSVTASIRSGKPLPADLVAKITGRYADRLKDIEEDVQAAVNVMHETKRTMQTMSGYQKRSADELEGINRIAR